LRPLYGKSTSQARLVNAAPSGEIYFGQISATRVLRQSD
jgi:hypothetical protein